MPAANCWTKCGQTLNQAPTRTLAEGRARLVAVITCHRTPGHLETTDNRGLLVMPPNHFDCSERAADPDEETERRPSLGSGRRLASRRVVDDVHLGPRDPLTKSFDGRTYLLADECNNGNVHALVRDVQHNLHKSVTRAAILKRRRVVDLEPFVSQHLREHPNERRRASESNLHGVVCTSIHGVWQNETQPFRKSGIPRPAWPLRVALARSIERERVLPARAPAAADDAHRSFDPGVPNRRVWNGNISCHGSADTEWYSERELRDSVWRSMRGGTTDGGGPSHQADRRTL